MVLEDKGMPIDTSIELKSKFDRVANKQIQTPCLCGEKLYNESHMSNPGIFSELVAIG